MKNLKTIFIFLFCINRIIIFSEDWNFCRYDIEGKASISYDGTGDINEWQYTYKSSRRYSPGLSVWASPAIDIIDGKPIAFIGGYDQTLHAMDLLYKKVVWRKLTNAEIQTAPVIGKINDVDIVFWTSADRSVYAFNARDGQKIWIKEIIGSSNTMGKVNISSPFLFNKRLYITSFAYDKAIIKNKQEGVVFCINAENGEIIFKKVISDGFLNNPAGFYYKNNFYLIIGSRRGLVQCFKVVNDDLIKEWDYQMPQEVIGFPVITIETKKPLLFLGSKFGNLVALDALTGKLEWKKMAGNWIDNSACIGKISGKNIVYVGSHDYFIYAYEAENGNLLWKKPLGGEIYSAPCFFKVNNNYYISVAALDNHLYVLDAKDGKIITSYFTGNPIWDKLIKGENLWGSPVALEAGNNTSIIFGSYNDMVLVLPLFKDCSLKAMAKSSCYLWLSLLYVFILFTFIILPVVIKKK